MQYTLKNEELYVTIDSFGAEIISVKKNGVERSWQNENNSWAGHAPVLFPYAGKVNVVVDDKKYPFLAHGFAKRMEFTLVEEKADALSFRLTSGEKTLEKYPFDFVFTVTYQLEGSQISISYQTENVGDRPLYYSSGGHDSFALQSHAGEYYVEFEKEETFNHYCHDGEGFLTGEVLNWGTGTRLPLPEEYLSDGSTIIFKDLQSNKVTLCEKDGAPLAEVGFPDFANLLFWHPAGAKMICIEPWNNMPDTLGQFNLEISQKQLQKVDAGKTHVMRRWVKYF